MSDKKLMDQLVQLVMSENQAKVYLSMLNKGGTTAAELRRKAGIPHSKIYDTLDFLVSQGYCIKRKTGKKQTYEIIDPLSAIKPNINRLESRIKKLNELAEQLAEVHSRSGKSKEPFEYIEIIHGNDNIHERYLQLLNSANFENLGLIKPPYASQTKEMGQIQEAACIEFLKRGGKAKVIIEANEDTHPRSFDSIRSSHENGEIFRVASKLPLKMFIFDRKILLIADQSALAEENVLSMTVIKQDTTVKGYIALFEFLWEQALEYEDWIVVNQELMDEKMAEHKKLYA